MNQARVKDTSEGASTLIVEVLRGDIVESQHRFSMAMVNGRGQTILTFGNTVEPIFFRSSAKPFQAIPLVEHGVLDDLDLNAQQLAVMCSSHSGTDEHADVVRSILEHAGFDEEDLQCGIHAPSDRATTERLLKQETKFSPLRHNCSGKHAGMLLLSRYLHEQKDRYLHPDGRVQGEILKAFSEMVGVSQNKIVVGIDGCSAPNFAVPLPDAAFGYARLMDPSDLGEKRATAVRRIVAAMLSCPEMVSGHGRFDTELMQSTKRRLLSKGGAEGYQAIGIPENVLQGGRAAGLVLKVHDGDLGKRARSVATLAILETLGLIKPDVSEQLSGYAERALFNYRGLEVGHIRLAGESRQRVQQAYERI